MESENKIKPNFLQKIFGAKELKLNIKNYLLMIVLFYQQHTHVNFQMLQIMQ